jgi:hypothetical protein
MHHSFDKTTLTLSLKKHLSLNLARVKFLSLFIWSMMEGRTVNMARLSSFVESHVSNDSIYKRFQRFLKEILLTDAELAPLLLSIMGICNAEKLTLILDRTNWKFGKIHINILYLAVAFHGIAIPIFWSLLEDKKRGNSDHLDRIDLIKRFIKVFGKERIDVILGDREFIGEHWVDWLKGEGIGYVLRAKEDGQCMANARGEMVKAASLFQHLRPGESLSLGRRKIGKTNHYESFVSGVKTSTGEILVLIHSGHVMKPWEEYRKRWQIEVMFKALKSGGFNMEDTHVTNPERLEVLFGVLAIACCVAYRIGDMYLKEFSPNIKAHGYKPKSIIRYGLDLILKCIRLCDKNATKLLNNFFKPLGSSLLSNNSKGLKKNVL